ncbi:ABC transporter permease, partial [Streptomyces sp. 900105755]
MTPPTPSAAASLEVTNESVQKPIPADGSKGSENRSPGRLAWMRFKRDRTGVISAFVVGFFFLVAAAAPLIAKLYGKNPYTVYADVRPEL